MLLDLPAWDFFFFKWKKKSYLIKGRNDEESDIHAFIYVILFLQIIQ